MRTRALGRSGLQVSEVSLGSWLTMGSRVDMVETSRLVSRAFDLGINLFDTADVYADGEAEMALGKAIGSLPRGQVVLATKCFFPTSEAPTDRGLSRKHIVQSVEGSLTRLGTDYLDLHQCHRFDPDTPLEETVRAYEDLIRAGKLLYWGVSHWTGEQLEAGCSLADFHGAYRPVSNQPEYSILRRQIEADILPVSQREGIGQIVFSPLAQGALTGKYRDGKIPDQSRASDPKRNRWMNDYLGAATLERVEGLRPIAEQLGLSMAELALAWCLRSPVISSVLVGATRFEQLEENVRAAGTQIPESIAAEIDRLFPAPKEELRKAPENAEVANR